MNITCSPADSSAPAMKASPRGGVIDVVAKRNVSTVGARIRQTGERSLGDAIGNPSGTARARLAPPGSACSDPPGATRLYVKWSCPNRGPLAGGGELVEELVGEQRGP